MIGFGAGVCITTGGGPRTFWEGGEAVRGRYQETSLLWTASIMELRAEGPPTLCPMPLSCPGVLSLSWESCFWPPGPQHMNLLHSLASRHSQQPQARGDCVAGRKLPAGVCALSPHAWFPSPPHYTSRQRLITSICPTDSRGSSCQGSKNFQIPPHPVFPGFFSSAGPLVAPPCTQQAALPHATPGRAVGGRGGLLQGAGQEGPLVPSPPGEGPDSSREYGSWKTRVKGAIRTTLPFYR